MYRNRFDRIRHHVDDFNALLPRANAIFGIEVHAPMTMILHIYNSFQWSAIKLPESFGEPSGSEEAQHLEILRRTNREDNTDRIEEELKAQTALLDGELLPILRAHT